MYDIIELNKKLLPELKEIAKNMNIKRVESLRKQDLVYRILDQQAIDASEKKTQKAKPKDLERKVKPNEKKKFPQTVPIEKTQTTGNETKTEVHPSSSPSEK